MALVLSVLEQGFIYTMLALGIYITYKILDFPDLTVDSSFPLGAAVCVVMIKNGINPYISLPAAFIAGGISGFVTGIIHVKFKVRDLLSGIITMTMLYSVNLHITSGQANVPIFSNDTIFTLSPIKDIAGDYNTVIVIFVIAFICKIAMDLYLKTKSGYLLRAVGDNETVVTSLAKDKGTVKIIGLVIANALVALAGCVMCQQQRFFDISMGTGTMVIGLASVIIGTNVFGKLSFLKTTTTVIIGSIIYKACVAIAIACGMQAIDMKLITGALFLIILIVSSLKKGGVDND
ncbi:MAG: ABC transporter permease [Clostridia bacterium]|nr:ABC transporter permease [Clostridia bacterium]